MIDVQPKKGQRWCHNRSGGILRVVETDPALLLKNENGVMFEIGDLPQFFKAHTLLDDETGEPVKPEPRAFQVGDVVQLKSGGPPMTVYRADKDEGGPFVGCLWHLADGTIFERHINPAVLIHVQAVELDCGGGHSTSGFDIEGRWHP